MSKPDPAALRDTQVDELERTLGPEARDRLLRLVAEHARGAPSLILAASIDGPDRVRRAAHSLRGAVQTVGADALADVLGAIEHGPPLEDGDERWAALAREAEAVAAAAEAMLARRD